jgi:hypothetical protein
MSSCPFIHHESPTKKHDYSLFRQTLRSTSIIAGPVKHGQQRSLRSGMLAPDSLSYPLFATRTVLGKLNPDKTRMGRGKRVECTCMSLGIVQGFSFLTPQSGISNPSGSLGMMIQGRDCPHMVFMRCFQSMALCLPTSCTQLALDVSTPRVARYGFPALQASSSWTAENGRISPKNFDC